MCPPSETTVMDSGWFVRRLRLCSSELNSKRSISHFLVSFIGSWFSHHLFGLTRACNKSLSFLFFFILFHKKCSWTPSVTARWERIWPQENIWGLSALCEMMKQTVYVVLSHALNSTSWPWNDGLLIGFGWSVSLSQSVYDHFMPATVISIYACSNIYTV